MSEAAKNTPKNSDLLWQPSTAQVESSLLFDFMEKIKGRYGENFADYHGLWRWSVDHPEEFWDALWDYAGVVGEKGDVVLRDADKMPGQIPSAQFFPEARVNYAENLLRKNDSDTAMIFRREDGEARSLTYAQLHGEVSRWQQAFKAAGIGEGDRVAAFMPNCPETIIVCLAAASLGAIFSSASPDFGVQGLVDRFGQIQPKILVAIDGYLYNGKRQDCTEKLRDAVPQILGVDKVVVVNFFEERSDISHIESALYASDFLAPYEPSDLTYTRVRFNHPLFIMFSSGTTGAPKCIVHGHGGTLLQHLKEHKLQSNIQSGDKVFYFTTCGWMMWNWLISGLAAEATLMLFDGSPFYPDGEVLWEYAQKHSCTFFGTSAKYIDALKSGGVHPAEKYDLSSVRTMASTGSPLVHESFDFVYKHIKSDLHLASISGGTDIVSCFMLGNPISPVYRGELQGPGLGMAVDIFDEDGTPTSENAGELVCIKPFPAMPVQFWNDADGARYKAAYFERFENIWCHGDWVEKTPHGGFIIHGRSDATLNPGGVRIGTAEIYRQVEQVEAVTESIAVGQDWDGDVRVILFVTLKDGAALDEDLIKDIKTRIRTGASPRHVPAKVIQVSDIPRTKSGKITELAVRDVIMGRKVKNVEALANPEALALYENLEELTS